MDAEGEVGAVGLAVQVVGKDEVVEVAELRQGAQLLWYFHRQVVFAPELGLGLSAEELSWSIYSDPLGYHIVVVVEFHAEPGMVLYVGIEVPVVFNTHLNIVGEIPVDEWYHHIEAAERSDHSWSKASWINSLKFITFFEEDCFLSITFPRLRLKAGFALEEGDELLNKVVLHKALTAGDELDYLWLDSIFQGLQVFIVPIDWPNHFIDLAVFGREPAVFDVFEFIHCLADLV